MIEKLESLKEMAEILNEENLNILGIKSITTISEPSFPAKLILVYNNGNSESYNIDQLDTVFRGLISKLDVIK